MRTGALEERPPATDEIRGLLRSGEKRLDDAERNELSFESRFDLAYNAAHALSLAALRNCGFRPKNRYVVFQCLAHTLGLAPTVWRVLAKAHGVRNQAEYEGYPVGEQRLLDDLIRAAHEVLAALEEELKG